MKGIQFVVHRDVHGCTSYMSPDVLVVAWNYNTGVSLNHYSDSSLN
jgi:hypothetical protein